MADKVNYCGIAVTRLTPNELIQQIKRTIKDQTTLSASYVHFHTVNLIRRNPRIDDNLARFDIVIPDGIAVLWSSKLFGTSFRRDDIVTTYELFMPVLISEAIRRGWSFFLFGGTPGVATRAMGNLIGAFPGIRVAGTHHGYLASREEMDALVALIARVKPTILLVGLGQPKQEEWILGHRDQLGANIILAVGSYFDKLAKSISIYPDWVRRTRLFWLYRMLTEPGYVWKRYTVGVMLFSWNVLRMWLGRRFRSLGNGM